MSRHDDTIAALATPDGTAALALIRVSGPASADLVQKIFGRTPVPREATNADYKDRAGILVDDVLFTYFAKPRSYTGENSLEISCHGSPFIAQKILEDLFARGCRPAGPGEFTQRAFLNGRLDLSQAEAVMDLIRARSDRALAAAHQQLHGALTRRVEILSGEILNVLAEIEARIDFPEEDIPAENRTALASRLEQSANSLGQLAATSRYGDLLRDGMLTVLVGAPNVGKSSLLNRLVGHNRAIVSEEPGTTRDFIEERITLGAHCVRLVDTAGLNPNPGPLESRGIEKTLEQISQAALVLLVLDSTLPPPKDFPPGIRPSNTLVVLNKSDLQVERVVPNALKINSPLHHAPYIAASALTGAGIDQLIAAISSFADRQLTSFSDGELIAVNARHAHALARAQTALALAREKLSSSAGLELVASELREALDSLGSISGRLDNERMLDQLFSSFCIGK